MLRAMVPALRKSNDKSLLALLCVSTIAIGLFYGSAGLFYGERTAHHRDGVLARWWVVQLVGRGNIRGLCDGGTRLHFREPRSGLTTPGDGRQSRVGILFMVGGVPGTFHHLYFSGTTTPVMAVGAAFSALEVVPLIVLGYEARERWDFVGQAAWMQSLKWPLMCFIAVAFWNMLGARIFGFMINTPAALFYLQGLNTTAVHAHAALFGVYGFLALGFVLLVLRYLRPELRFNETLMRTGFWCLNGGLVLMIFTSLLPIGLFQFAASTSVGMWYARSDAFLQQGFLETLRWIPASGDV